MLLELAIGDAYGAGFEYSPPAFVREHNTLVGYVQHPRHKIRPGCYTDDAQMTLAIAEHIVSGDPWEPARLAQRFVEVFKRDPREGYARGFYGLLTEVADGADLLARLRPTSDKSGAAMRAGPIGLLSTPARVAECARIQAAITHDTPDGIRAAVAAALIVHYFHREIGPASGLGRWLGAHVPHDWVTPWKGKVGAKGMMSVHAAVTSLMEAKTMSGLLRACIAWTGDVDTVATIALAAGSVAKDIEQDLPQVLIDTLENETYGRDYLRKLDGELLARE